MLVDRRDDCVPACHLQAGESASIRPRQRGYSINPKHSAVTKPLARCQSQKFGCLRWPGQQCFRLTANSTRKSMSDRALVANPARGVFTMRSASLSAMGALTLFVAQAAVAQSLLNQLELRLPSGSASAPAGGPAAAAGGAGASGYLGAELNDEGEQG